MYVCVCLKSGKLELQVLVKEAAIEKNVSVLFWAKNGHKFEELKPNAAAANRIVSDSIIQYSIRSKVTRRSNNFLCLHGVVLFPQRANLQACM